MKPMPLDQIAKWAEGTLDGGRGDRCVMRVCSDSRKVQPGDLFVALEGDRFDGHKFLDDILEKGAVAALVRRQEKSKGGKLSLIKVEDTLKGLQVLASNYRKSLEVKVVGITGSNGKTSAKEFIAQVLGKKFKATKTQGNLNNHIGLPLTLLSMKESDKMAVIEIGMNHRGEIAHLAKLAKPDYAVVTSVGWAHIEFFKDRDEIAQEKGDLVREVSREGVCILNGDDERVRKMSDWTASHCVSVGSTFGLDYYYDSVNWDGAYTNFTLHTSDQDLALKIGYPGWHMVQNASLAGALGIELGVRPIDLKAGLMETAIPGGRLLVERLNDGWLLDDSYNANPDSMIAAFRTLNMMSGGGRRVAILGSMGELGERSRELHQAVGKVAEQEGVGLLLAVGEYACDFMKGATEEGLNLSRAIVCTNHHDLVQAYMQEQRSDDVVLVKGSRLSSMEKVSELLREEVV
ncbi:MAG: UDP-N-acetylmuramoyl-tripeptide--D-alanyl-D-alanine ligase [Verrucomicrobiota bacterium]